MRRGAVRERLDVNYWAGSHLYEAYYSQPNFPLVPLRNLVTLVQYGISERATTEQIGVPILRMNNLQQDGWDFSELKFVQLNPETKAQFLLRPGDILFNRTNSKELVGKCDVFAEQGEWVFASYLIRVRLDRNLALPVFVSEFLNTDAGRVQINRVSRQIIGMSNVNAEELQDLVIPLPPIDEQRLLVWQLLRAKRQRDEKLAEAEAQLGRLDGYILKQLGVDLPEGDNVRVYAVRLAEVRESGRLDSSYNLPGFKKMLVALRGGKYPLTTINELCEAPVGGATPKKGDLELYTDSGIRFLRILNIRPNEIDLNNVKYISSAVHNEDLLRSQLRENDVLLTITGRVGTAAVVTPEIPPANINQHIVRLRITNDACSPEYLAAYLNTSVGLTISNRGVTGGTRIALDYDAIRSLPVPLPPPHIQKSIVNEVHELQNTAMLLREQAEREWEASRRGFLQHLLGERIA